MTHRATGTCLAASTCSSASDLYSYTFSNELASWSAALDTVYYTYDGNDLLQKEVEYQSCCAIQRRSAYGVGTGGKPMGVPVGELPPARHGSHQGARRASLPAITVNLTWNTAGSSPALANMELSSGWL